MSDFSDQNFVLTLATSAPIKAKKHAAALLVGNVTGWRLGSESPYI